MNTSEGAYSIIVREFQTENRRITGETTVVNLNADGKDLSFVTVRILDAKGNLCPMADNLVEFTVEGAGKLEAVGNGDQATLAPFIANEREAFSGMCLAIIRTKEKGGTIRLKAASKGLETAYVSIIAN